MKHFVWLALFLFAQSGTSMASTEKRCAIVLHGLGRTSLSMNKVAWVLSKNNFIVWNESYPSTSLPIEELTPIIDVALSFCHNAQASDIYFVTHSMGGILMRNYFQNHSSDGVTAAVMLAPPNHGSEVVDAYRESWWFQQILGPAAQQLGTENLSFTNSLKPLTFPIGVIAGNSSSDPWFNHLFTGEHDGKVSVESTKLKEMKDHIVVGEGHTFIMDSNEVLNQMLYFFEHLSFKK